MYFREEFITIRTQCYLKNRIYFKRQLKFTPKIALKYYVLCMYVSKNNITIYVYNRFRTHFVDLYLPPEDPYESKVEFILNEYFGKLDLVVAILFSI